MVHRIAVYLSKHLANYIGWQEKTSLLTYGMEMFVGEMFKFIILIAISSFVGILKPTLLILAVTIPFRLTFGGGHLKTFTSCAVVTILVFFVLAFTADKLIPFFNLEAFPLYLAGLFVATMGAIYWWVPGKHHAKDFSSKSEQLKFKRLSRILVSLWAISCLLIYLTMPGGLALFFASTAMGIAWQDFLVSPLGYKFLNITEALITPNIKEVN